MRIALKNIARIRSGYQLRGRLVSDPMGTHRIVQMRDLIDEGLGIASLSRFTPKRSPDQFAISRGDVLFQSRGTSHTAAVVDEVPENTVASNHFFIVSPEREKLLPDYLAWYLNSKPVQGVLAANAQGTTTMLVPKRTFENLEIEVPSLEIQEQVAEIAALRRKERQLVAALDMKRGVLIEAACLNAVNTGKERGE